MASEFPFCGGLQEVVWPDGGLGKPEAAPHCCPGESPSGCVSSGSGLYTGRPQPTSHIQHLITDITTFIKLGKLRGLRGEKQELQTTPKQERKAEGRGLTQGREKKEGWRRSTHCRRACDNHQVFSASSLNRVRNTQPNFQQRYGRLFRHGTAGAMGMPMEIAI